MAVRSGHLSRKGHFHRPSANRKLKGRVQAGKQSKPAEPDFDSLVLDDDYYKEVGLHAILWNMKWFRVDLRRYLTSSQSGVLLGVVVFFFFFFLFSSSSASPPPPSSFLFFLLLSLLCLSFLVSTYRGVREELLCLRFSIGMSTWSSHVGKSFECVCYLQSNIRVPHKLKNSRCKHDHHVRAEPTITCMTGTTLHRFESGIYHWRSLM